MHSVVMPAWPSCGGGGDAMDDYGPSPLRKQYRDYRKIQAPPGTCFLDGHTAWTLCGYAGLILPVRTTPHEEFVTCPQCLVKLQNRAITELAQGLNDA